jgi:hypothetical protein
MLDIETLGIAPGSIVLEIAAATFDTEGNIHAEFTRHIDILDSLANGLTADPDTCKWHIQRRTNIHYINASVFSLWHVMSSLRMFIDHHRPFNIWAWGMDFERAHLQHLATLIGQPLPWPYYKSADARTVWNVAYTGKKPERRPHTALEDVRAQIRDLTQARHHLRQS